MMSESIRKKPELNKGKLEEVKKRMPPTVSGALARELAEYIANVMGTFHNSRSLGRAMAACWDKKPADMASLADFYTPSMRKAVFLLLGQAGVDDVEHMLKLRLGMIFSSTPFRRSYHRECASQVMDQLPEILVSCVAWYFYELTTLQAAEHDTSSMRGFLWRMSLELSRGEEDAVNIVREAVLGDNSRVLLSVQIIRAVVISGNREGLELLGKLLLAAKQQEGIRQQILENMDWGSAETILYFLRLILDNDLTRFSSVIRAMDTWTGLGYGSAKPGLAKKCVKLAADVLSDAAAIEEYGTSADNLELYFALWGTAVRQLGDTLPMIERLLRDEQSYRRLTALYFVSCADDHEFSVQIALEHLNEPDDETLAWVLRLLDQGSPCWGAYLNRKAVELENCPYPKAAQKCKTLFDQLEKLVERIGNRCQPFQGSVFPWMQVTLSAAPALNGMVTLAAISEDPAMVDQLLKHWREISPEGRQFLQRHFLRPEQNTAHRRFLIDECLTDRSSAVRENALNTLSSMRLEEVEIAALCDALSSRSSDYRQKLVELLAKQSKSRLSFALDRLLAEKDERRLQGGLSLLMAIQGEQSHVAAPCLERLKTLDTAVLDGQTLVLMRQLTGGGEEWTAENGFGLYDPQAPCFLPKRPAGEPPEKAGLLSRILGKKAEGADLFSDSELSQMLSISDDVVLDLFRRMNQVFRDHADYEYEVDRWGGGRDKVLLGNAEFHLAPAAGTNRADDRLENYPFWQEFLTAAGPLAGDAPAMSCILCRLEYYLEENVQPWFRRWVSGFQKGTLRHTVWSEFGNVTGSIEQLLQLMRDRAQMPDYFQKCFRIYVSLAASLKEENWPRPHTPDTRFYDAQREGEPAITCGLLTFWRQQAQRSANTDEDFAACFRQLRFEALTVGKNYSPLYLEMYLQAYDLGLVPEDVIYQQLTIARAAPNNLRQLTDHTRRNLELMERFPRLEEWVRRAVDRIVTLEEQRGELPTPLTQCVGGIREFEGMAHFAALLTALGKDDFFRGYEYHTPEDKRASLSRLLKHCRPAKDDTAEELGYLVQQAGIKPERLAQAAMYAPQWAALMEQITGWVGLKSGVWLFHAHVNESFSAEKETEVAVYSPITPQAFNDGAFDRDWFLSVYHTLGENRFRVLYRCAKYITTGSIQHRRSQLYADAVLGKLDAAALLAEVQKNRSQDKLRAWPLIPLKDGHEALARYEYIRQFEKESRQFGAQRRDSERRASRTALSNLAIAMDCPDVDRMIWRLEGQKLDEILPLLEPKVIGEAALSLRIDSDGAPSLFIQKNGKPQKTLPAALKKNETVLVLKQAVKDLTEQRRRAKQSLEQAMVTGSAFHTEEVKGLLGNPVLGPLAAALLWRSGASIGLPVLTDGVLKLMDCGGTAFPVAGELLVAHPYHLMEAGCWSDWQRRVFTQQLVQPFKQVFREYYPLTEEERFERTLSRRYAGNQVQPKKAVALLRGRGWTVDYEEGLQKVCYTENIIIRIFAMADWFSPAEAEPPTLKIVQFFDRATGELRPLDSVPPITFSEAMRDLDLMVSVAHAGGVDPETSHSTVEMRVAIAQELLQLLQVRNVELLGSHAKIHGKLGSYSVHMGSAVTHMEGKGSLVILPVHSQTRGRVFLPFADDDPKTAEIMSKLLLLAEDGKIKDPAILAQIATR